MAVSRRRSIRDGADDAIGALNTAFVADGYFLDIAAGAELAAPVELQNVQAGGQTHVRLPVRVGDGAKATIVERQTGTGAAFVSSVSQRHRWRRRRIHLADRAGAAGRRRPISASSTPRLGKDAKLTLFVMNAGGKLVRQEIHVLTKGEGSTFTLRGVNLLAGDTHTDVTMVLDHAVPHTGSTEVIRNVVTGRARASSRAASTSHQYAQKTDAKMACNTLLLSDDGEFSTKPELEIFADDVQCGHGATVTEIDRNHLFYLMARGIDEKTARGLLVEGFRCRGDRGTGGRADGRGAGSDARRLVRDARVNAHERARTRSAELLRRRGDPPRFPDPVA